MGLASSPKLTISNKCTNTRMADSTGRCLLARRTGRFSVAVVDEIDDATASVLARAADLVVEVWCDEAPEISIDERIARLLEAHRAGGVHVLRLAVRFADIDGLRAVAGEPLWGYATSG